MMVTSPVVGAALAAPGRPGKGNKRFGARRGGRASAPMSNSVNAPPTIHHFEILRFILSVAMKTSIAERRQG
jgi:hypothetical protein